MDYEQFAVDVVNRARQAGAAEADVYLQSTTEFDVQVRKSEVETLTQAGRKGMGLRVFVDGRQGFATTSDFAPEAIERTIAQAVSLAAVADQRPENRLGAVSALSARPELQLFDPEVQALPVEDRIGMAMRCEAACSAVDPRITNSEGNGYGSETHHTVLANSHGVVGSYLSSACSLYAHPLAEQDGKKQVDFDWSFSRLLKGLDSPETVGRNAAARVLRKLGARKAPTQKATVIFDRRVAARLWAAIGAAVNGDNVYKGMSFLRDKLGTQIASELVTLTDDPTIVSGAGSAPFDGDGLPTQRNMIIEQGVLKTFLYDVTTSIKVGNGAVSTASARRSFNSLPQIGTFNLYLSVGTSTVEEMVRGVQNGFLVTEMMGAGANIVTGDFSTGAGGMWIENGELTYPVEEVTIASTVDELLRGVVEVGNDLIFNSGVASPTFQVESMTISGL
jgi:PmbA protein